MLISGMVFGQLTTPIRSLIIDGQNNHSAWPKTTMMIKKYLEDTKRYTVDIARTKYTVEGEELLKTYPLNDGIEREAKNNAVSDRSQATSQRPKNPRKENLIETTWICNPQQ